MTEGRLVTSEGVTLQPVSAATVTELLHGELGEREAAPGWPHQDSEPGLSFVRSGGSSFLILDADGRVCGECGTKAPPRPDGTVEIGYGLAAPSRGRGLGTAAVRALVGWLVEQPEVRTVEAEVHVGNLASRRLVERLGFSADARPSAGYLRYRFTRLPGQPNRPRG